MTNLHDTARTMLSVLRGIAALGGGQHLTSKFTPEVKALLAHLDGKVPGLMNTWLSGEERCNGITVRSPDSYDQMSFQMVAPGCYESFHPFRLAAEVEAYHALVRLAEADSPTLARDMMDLQHERASVQEQAADDFLATMRQAIPVIEPGLTPHAVLVINDAAEAFAGTFAGVPPQYSIGGVRDGKVHVTMAVDIDVASLNAFAGALGGAS